MPNTFITPSIVAKTALGFWQNGAVLPMLFNRQYEGDFAGAVGDTITIKKQASLTAARFNPATGIVLQDVIESSMTLTIGQPFDVSVQIDQRQWDFDLADFAWEVMEPMGRALVRESEKTIAAKLATATPSALDPTKPLEAIINARKQLNVAEVPLDGRFMIVGAGVAATLIGSSQFLQAQMAGGTEAFREARIGRLFGMDVYESVVVPEGDAYVCHKDALTLLSLVPVIPRGIVDGSGSSYDGLGMRVMFFYDQLKKKDIISADVYFECGTLRGVSAFKRLQM
jgi:hypothetical protein